MQWAGLPKLRAVIEAFQGVEHSGQAAPGAHLNYMMYATEASQLKLRLREMDRRFEQQEGRRAGQEHRLTLHKQRDIAHALAVEEALPIRREEDSRQRKLKQEQRLERERERLERQESVPTMQHIDRPNQ